MKVIKNLNKENISSICKLISNEKDFEIFFKLGWNMSNLENQLIKKNNFSIGYFFNKKLIGILIGEKILNEDNKFSLEIHIIYVPKIYRRKYIASDILDFIIKNKKSNKISKLYLEVSELNEVAIKFYEKNSFVFCNFRLNYYTNNNKKINEKFYYKVV